MAGLCVAAAPVGVRAQSRAGAEAVSQIQDSALDQQDQDDDREATRSVLSWFEGRFAVHANGGYQGGSDQTVDTFGFRAYGEDARFDASHDISGGGMFDVGASLLVWRELSVGASYTQLDGSNRVTVSGAVPHPIEFNNPRAITPQTLSLTHRERATHIFGAWRVPLQQVEKLDVSVFGGLSLFNVTQGVVTNVTAREAGGPPFVAVTVDQVQTGERWKNGVGGHVGVDVTYMVTDYVGVGFFARFTGGSVDLPSAGVGTVSLNLGGIQTGGGVRFRF